MLSLSSFESSLPSKIHHQVGKMAVGTIGRARERKRESSQHH